MMDCIVTKPFGFARVAFMAQRLFTSLAMDAVYVLCLLYVS